MPGGEINENDSLLLWLGNLSFNLRNYFWIYRREIESATVVCSAGLRYVLRELWACTRCKSEMTCHSLTPHLDLKARAVLFLN